MKELLTRNRKRFIYYIIGALLTAVTGISVSLALANAFGIFEATNQTEVIKKIVLTAVLGLSPILIQVISRYMRIGFMRDVLVDVRKLAYEKMMKIPIEEFREKKRDDYLALLVNDINIFERDYFLSLLNIIYSYGSFVIGEIILFVISPAIAFIILIASVLIYVVTKFFEKPIRTSVKRNQEANSHYNEQVSNILGGLEVIKLYQVEDKFRPPFYEMVSKLEGVKRRTNLFQTGQRNLIEWIGNVLQVGLFVFATYLYVQDKISLSDMILVYSFSGQMIWTNVNGASMINTFHGAIDIFNRITSQPVWASGNEAFSLRNRISVNHVNFSYGDKKVLDNIQFVIDKGSKVLIYGPSGTGKTTLLNCLSQNLTSYTGEILIDHTELKTINFESMLDHCGYVRQQHFMFEDSIKNNIILGEPVDEKKFKQVLIDVDLWDWINTLPDKENHLLTQNGSNISGGQRQRISIARELYRECDVLFVDEPSASLDDETAKVLYDTLFNLNKTLVVVSHRHLDYLRTQVDQVIEFSMKGGYSVEQV